MQNIKIYILDNSVVLKPILEEEGAEIVNKLFFLKNKYKISILVPDIFRYEFFNRLTREKNASVALKAYNYFINRQVSVIPLESDLIRLANKLVTKYPKISFYDAAYHALAKAYDADLITADKKYYQKTRAEGNVRLLEDLKI